MSPTVKTIVYKGVSGADSLGRGFGLDSGISEYDALMLGYSRGVVLFEELLGALASLRANNGKINGEG